ncbi:hypothetical protein NKH24_07045 [Mesorhizobium sp. M1300]|uniref:hypothetical protein n=1 Tax=Mesorhizobium sp. M1300 TaxID=2957077 RepID=UPI00333A072A
MRQGGKAWIRAEVEDILGMHLALERAGSAVQFQGFDLEGEGASAMPYEGEHHICSEFLQRNEPL